MEIENNYQALVLAITAPSQEQAQRAQKEAAGGGAMWCGEGLLLGALIVHLPVVG